MGHTRILFLVLGVAALQACKHPLAIEGEGDIVELTNSGRGCTLEQFQAGDPACTDNEVTGDYFVNYRAEPRPGWRFLRWDGPCANNSDFQHCRFDIDADTVAWWETNYPDAEATPSIAVFAPIEGQGARLSGTSGPIAGVTYKTRSITGVTGVDGSFYFQPWETVSFSIGDLLLGEVKGEDLGQETGKYDVTLFDLADSPIVTGDRIDEALDNEDDPFNAVINLAVLLETLDSDSDPYNGIQINSATSAQFDGLYLELQQYPGDFLEQLALRNAVSRGNRRQVFEKPHRVPDTPAPALQRLYEGLSLIVPTLAASRTESTYRGAVADEILLFDYDTGGNLVSRGPESWTYNANGSPTRYTRDPQISEEGTRLYYNERGQPTLHQTDYDNDGQAEHTARWTYDERGLEILFEEGAPDRDQPDYTRSRSYDADGLIVGQRETNHNEDEDDLVIISQWVYGKDQSGRVLRFDWQSEGDEPLSATAVYNYDPDGRIERVTLEGDVGSIPGAIETTGIPEIPHLQLAEAYEVSYRYDDHGALLEETRAGRNESLGSLSEYRQFNSDGQVTRLEARLNDGLDVTTYEYDSRGNIVSETVDVGGDGAADSAQTWGYDTSGFLIQVTTFFEGTEHGPYSVETYENDARGNPTRTELTVFNRDEDEDEEDRALAEVSTASYEYDSRFNVIKRENFSEESTEPYEILNYRYYADDVLAFEEMVERNVEPGETSVWEYDENGNLVRFESQHDEDEFQNTVEVYTYDSYGNLVGQTTDNEGDGRVDRTHAWHYDNRGSLVAYQTQCPLNYDFPEASCGFDGHDFSYPGTIHYVYGEGNRLASDRHERDFDNDGTPDLIISNEYDEFGRDVRNRIEDGGDFLEETIITSEYDSEGRVIRETRDDNANGQLDLVITWTYDDEGRLLRKEGDEGANGTIDFYEFTEYDEFGNVVREGFDENGDGTLEHEALFYRSYDADGNEIRIEEDENGDGNINRVVTMEYDERGNMVRRTVDEDMNGTLDYGEVNVYDPYDNLLAQEIDGDGDGLVERWLYYSYDLQLNRVSESHRRDLDADGEWDEASATRYRYTGWGHLFN